MKPFVVGSSVGLLLFVGGFFEFPRRLIQLHHAFLRDASLTEAVLASETELMGDFSSDTCTDCLELAPSSNAMRMQAKLELDDGRIVESTVVPGRGGSEVVRFDLTGTARGWLTWTPNVRFPGFLEAPAPCGQVVVFPDTARRREHGRVGIRVELKRNTWNNTFSAVVIR